MWGGGGGDLEPISVCVCGGPLGRGGEGGGGGGGGGDLETGSSGSSDVLHTHSLSHLHQQQTSLLTHLKHTLYTHRETEQGWLTISHCTMFMNVGASKVCL